jgi:threonine/homoserine/homoserine lactone efflux protein
MNTTLPYFLAITLQWINLFARVTFVPIICVFSLVFIIKLFFFFKEKDMVSKQVRKIALKRIIKYILIYLIIFFIIKVLAFWFFLPVS